jgi:hypothetical protein
MKLFTCTHCGQYAYFENTYCEQCKNLLGFEATGLTLKTLFTLDKGLLGFADSRKPTAQYRYCSNYQYGTCNWLVPADSISGFCVACELNRTIPDLSQSQYMARWKSLEWAKHRLVYSLLRMHLPVRNKTEDPDNGLLFDFMADTNGEDKVVFTGHDDGIITINIAEADDIEREMARRSMHEMYRTVLGHFRHEIGHYYWDRLIRDDEKKLNDFRELFGNDEADYEAALKKHYEQGPQPDWSNNYISSYASAHPWEDWAETWAHYMHIVDTLETAYSFGIKTNPLSKKTTEVNIDPYTVKDFNSIMDLWLPLTFTMNSLNRSMGLKDAYPFIITPAVVDKLCFIHGIVTAVPVNTQFAYS